MSAATTISKSGSGWRGVRENCGLNVKYREKIKGILAGKTLNVINKCKEIIKSCPDLLPLRTKHFLPTAAFPLRKRNKVMVSSAWGRSDAIAAQ